MSKRSHDEQVWMVLGVDKEGRGHVAVVVGTGDPKRACHAYQQSQPGFSPISWPSLSDLRKSVATMEMSVRDGENDICPVIVLDDDLPAPAFDSISCPVAVLRILDMIRATLVQNSFDDPFSNNNAKFSCSAFGVQAFCWNPERPGEFVWRDVRVSWYKNLHCQPMINRTPSEEELQDMLEECRAAIRLEAIVEDGTG